jgi:hypothetical protein
MNEKSILPAGPFWLPNGWSYDNDAASENDKDASCMLFESGLSAKQRDVFKSGMGSCTCYRFAAEVREFCLPGEAACCSFPSCSTHCGSTLLWSVRLAKLTM